MRKDQRKDNICFIFMQHGNHVRMKRPDTYTGRSGAYVEPIFFQFWV